MLVFLLNVRLKFHRLIFVSKVVPGKSEVQNSGDNELERSIKAAMMRMKKVAADSDDEDRGDDDMQSADWDS